MSRVRMAAHPGQAQVLVSKECWWPSSVYCNWLGSRNVKHEIVGLRSVSLRETCVFPLTAAVCDVTPSLAVKKSFLLGA